MSFFVYFFGLVKGVRLILVVGSMYEFEESVIVEFVKVLWKESF